MWRPSRRDSSGPGPAARPAGDPVQGPDPAQAASVGHVTLRRQGDVWSLCSDRRQHTDLVWSITRGLILGMVVAALLLWLGGGDEMARSTALVLLVGAGCIALLVYYLRATIPALVRAEFDLPGRRVTVHREPSHAPVTFGFDAIVRFEAGIDIGDTGDSWRWLLRLQDGTRIMLCDRPLPLNPELLAMLATLTEQTGIASTDFQA
jgi:hypothetical protein